MPFQQIGTNGTSFGTTTKTRHSGTSRIIFPSAAISSLSARAKSV